LLSSSTVTITSTGNLKSLVGFVQRRHGFDNQQVNAGFRQGANLLGKGRAGFVQAGLAQGLQAYAERTHRSGHPGFAGLLILEVLHGLPSQPYAGGVDFGHFPGQAMTRQPEAVGAKGVGFKNLGARLQILFVDRENQAGIGEIQLVVTAVDENPAGIEHSAHGAVGENGAIGKDVGKFGHSLVMLSQAGPPRQPAGPLCYTSVVISWAGNGSGPWIFPICWIGRPPSFVQAAATDRIRGTLRAFRRGKGF
jgi:hypothetical protein